MKGLRSIAVTGAAGRIGRAICNEARRNDIHVVGIDAIPCDGIVKADVRDTNQLSRLFEGAECVFHCAGLHAPHVGLQSEDTFKSINIDGTASVLRAAETAGTDRFVLTSTTAVYGGGAANDEPARWIDETCPSLPRTIYHSTKLEAEALVIAATGQHLTASIVRLGRCFPEPARLMAIYRLSRGINERDSGRAHLHAAMATGVDPMPMIATARTPFQRGDEPRLTHSLRALLEERCPYFVETFDRLGWVLPDRIDRVYDSSRAQNQWNWAPLHGFASSMKESTT
ncbi:NAD-dependent epimerase/dehydratase family protein [Algicella marina]|uniref:NAD-dependent epimerase/dehydratase family protein n=1 Tax=Algicella marina TaxID=2683284 RepID=A0A6P1T286_9RHOB|nr:NAD(P)-dependent oxidoreductase [Algicella marina]QHQ35419.1 NAD-dependent epimerase/dehydratase family protein [Algicella marina]